MAAKLQMLETHLSLIAKSGHVQRFPFIWLRDHCRCEECYNTKTHQIQSDVIEIPLDIKPSSLECDEKYLTIEWHDGHKTKYRLQWLEQIVFPKQKRALRKLWSKTDVFYDLNKSTISSDELLGEDGKGARALIKSLVKYGFVLVTNVKPTIEATQTVIERVFPVQKTFYGDMWSVTDDYIHEDTAYSNNVLAAHTDNTYFSDPAGLQVFHMLQHKGTGGETVLVDGFKAAENLKREDPDAFEILTRNVIESEYIETKTIHFAATNPVIKLHPVTKELFHIRYNIYDRAVFDSLPQEQISKFYEAYQTFGKEVRKSENEWWLKLQPGTILFFDNWRVLHGRASYTGKRNLCGCYVGRMDWIGKAKALGIEVE